MYRKLQAVFFPTLRNPMPVLEWFDTYNDRVQVTVGVAFLENGLPAGVLQNTGISFAEHQVSRNARSQALPGADRGDVSSTAMPHRKAIRMKGTYERLEFQVPATFSWEAVLQPIRISP